MNRLLIPLLILLAAGCGEGDSGRSANAHSPAAPQSVVGPLRALPALTGRVVDEANILSAPTESEVGSRLAALEAKTGDQLVVVTVPSIGNETIEDFARRLGNGWGVGRRELNNGVLLIVVPGDRTTRISVGNGLQGLLTDERARQIIQLLLPKFKDRRFDDGVKTGVEEIIRTLESEKKRPMPLDRAKVA